MGINDIIIKAINSKKSFFGITYFNIFLVCVWVLIGYGAYYTWKHRKNIERNGIKTKAVATKVEEKLKYTTVEYFYFVDDKKYNGRTTVGIKYISVGDTFPIFYDPEKPEESLWVKGK